ncbi:hypothetical protein [Pelagibius sp.]|uniref:hypothetical protein n=1 Tax=Pelagibius sp. TaxID=1931238 RepID=UPI003BAF043A
MIVFKDPFVTLSPGAANAWVTIDLSSEVSAAATGVAIRVRNLVDGDRDWGLRKPGAAVAFVDELDANAATFDFCGLSPAKEIEVWVGDTINIVLDLVAYFETEATFPDEIQGVGLGTRDTYETVSIAGFTGSETATAAFLFSRPRATDVYARKAGSSDTLQRQKDNLHAYLVGLDGSQQFEFYRGSSSESLYLRGWLTGGVNFPDNATEVTPAADAIWTEVTLPEGSRAGIFWVLDGAQPGQWGIRKKGSSEAAVFRPSQSVSLALAEADAERKIEVFASLGSTAGRPQIFLIGTVQGSVALVAAGAESLTEAAPAVFSINNDFTALPAGAESVTEAVPPAIRVAAPRWQREAEVMAILFSAYDEALAATIEGPPWPVGLEQLPGEGLSFMVLGGERQFCVADTDYSSGPDDTPANKVFEVRIEKRRGYEFSVRAFRGSRPDGRASESSGSIRLANGDGGLDSIARLGLTGRTLEVFTGYRGDPFSRFERIFVGTIGDVSWTEERLTLELRDRQTILNRPVQTRFYAGTGDEQGTAELAGKPMPIVLGEKRNVEPALNDPPNLIYHVHDGEADAVLETRDRGAALTDSGQAPASYAELKALTQGAGQDIEPGEYAVLYTPDGTWLKLGASPDGRITCDIRGDVAAGSFASTHGAIVRRLVETRAGVAPIELDEAAFEALDLDQPGVAGWWSGPEVKDLAQALTEIMASAGGWWAFTPLGLLTVGVLKAPENPVLVLDHSNLSKRRRPERQGPQPTWRWRVGYQALGVVQDPDGLASSLTAEDRKYYSTAARFADPAAATAESVLTKHRLAEDAETVGLWAEEDDAGKEAGRRQTLHGALRDIYECPAEGLGRRLWLGDSVTLKPTQQTNAVRYDLPKDFVVIGIEEGARFRNPRLTLWG